MAVGPFMESRHTLVLSLLSLSRNAISEKDAETNIYVHPTSNASGSLEKLRGWDRWCESYIQRLLAGSPYLFSKDIFLTNSTLLVVMSYSSPLIFFR